VPEFASDVSELTDGDGPRGLARRRFLTFLVTAPVLTVAARVGAEFLTPAKADAVVPSPPQPADVADFGDVMAALDQEVEERVKTAQGQLPALEDAREIAGDPAPLDIGERLWVGLALAAEKPHRGTPAILRGPI